MKQSAEQLYIELLKKALCFTIYKPMPVPVEFFWCRRGKIKKRLLAPLFKSVFGLFGAKLCFQPEFQPNEIEEGRIWPFQAHTMIGLKRMNNLQHCVETILKEKVPGDLIETGVWRGGACIFMRGILAVYGINDRKVYLADSFEGLPKPDAEKYPADEGDTHYENTFLAVSRAEVEANFRLYGLLDDLVVFVKGWFKDTLPNLPAAQFAIIRLDGDLYESTMDALNNLYQKLSVGGFCIIDDYFMEGCRKAVHDFRDKHGITEKIEPIDGMGVFWRKLQPNANKI
jgi:O-methyltransferase